MTDQPFFFFVAAHGQGSGQLHVGLHGQAFFFSMVMVSLLSPRLTHGSRRHYTLST
jgi:hypothetical protein